jgi:hypothetical protein
MSDDDDDDDDDDDGCHRARDVFFVDLQLAPGDLLYFSSRYMYLYVSPRACKMQALSISFSIMDINVYTA